MTTMTTMPMMTGAPVEITTSIHVPEETPAIRRIFTEYLAGAVNVHSIHFGERTTIRGTVANLDALHGLALPMMTVTTLGVKAAV